MKTLKELKNDLIRMTSYTNYNEEGLKKNLGWLLLQDIEKEIKEKHPTSYKNSYLENRNIEEKSEKEFLSIFEDYAKTKDGIEKVPATAENIKKYFTLEQLLDKKIDLSIIGRESWFIKLKNGVAVDITVLSCIYSKYQYNEDFQKYLMEHLYIVRKYESFKLYKNRDMLICDVLHEFEKIYTVKEFTNAQTGKKIKCVMRKDSEKIELKDAEKNVFVNPFDFKEFKEKIIVPDYEKIKTCNDEKLLNEISYKPESKEIYLKKLSFCYITYYSGYKDKICNVRMHYKSSYYDLLVLNNGLYECYGWTLHRTKLEKIIEGEKTRETIKKLLKIVYGYNED